MGEEHDEDDTDIEEDELDDDEESTGIAIANPLPTANVNEIAATVQACGGNILYVVSVEDLGRGEGLFDKLAPAMEKILNQDDTEGEEGDGEGEAKVKNLVVVVEGATTEQELVAAKTTLENTATTVLSTIVQPSSNRATTLQQVFDSVEFVASNGPIDELLEDIGSFCDPSTAASNVAKAAFKDASAQTTTVAGLQQSPLDLAAARKLLPLSRDALEGCMSTVQSQSSNDNGEMQLLPTFGALCDAAVERSMADFDTQAGANLLSSSSVAKQIRSDLVEEMYSELESSYEEQLDFLHTAAFESFRKSLSGLRLSPNLATDMEKVAADAVKLFTNTAKTLRAKKAKTAWPAGDSNASNLKKELKEYITLRLQAARADGKYKPAPRKGVTFGFHWLLPKPFGNDYRLEPWQVHAKDDLTYIPKDKVSDVRKDDVATGDWRNSVVPAPTANEMMYLK